MPWPFKATIASFAIFAVGAALIGRACFVSGWEAIAWFVYGLLTASAGLLAGLLFSILGAVRYPAWRRGSLIACAVAISLSVALILFTRFA